MKNKLASLFKSHWAKLLSIFFFILLLGSYVKIFAIGAPYSPGEILDPLCAPGEENCIVEISGGGSSPWLTSSSDIYYNDGNVGIGTDTPTAQLDIKLGTNISYNQTFNEDDGMGDSLDDATYSGAYTGGSIPNYIYVQIDGTKTSPDTFSYYDDNGDCPTVSYVPITGSSQLLCDGISITFDAVTGHSVSDRWEYNITNSSSNPVFKISDGTNNYFSVNAIAPDSIFLGTGAGIGAGEYSINSNFIGTNAGNGASGSYDSNFIGHSAGAGASGGSEYSNFIGFEAGKDSINSGFSNFIGYNAGKGSTNISDSNFISSAGVNTNNINASNFFGSMAGSGADGSNYSNFFGQQTGQGATGAYNSNFLGFGAGLMATDAYSSNFLGYDAGSVATGASGSNFLGNSAGKSATYASGSNFLGTFAGDHATSATYSNFLGSFAGSYTHASGSNFLGQEAGSYATNASGSNFLGYQSGRSATNATNSNFLGYQSGYLASSASNANFLGYKAGMAAESASRAVFIGNSTGYGASNASFSVFIGDYAGANNVTNTSDSSSAVFIGNTAGYMAKKSSNSIFLGQNAGRSDTVDNTTNVDDFSILIGKDTLTGGNKNSIALGGSATNTTQNQFMIGSITRPINTTIWNTAGGTTCTLVSTGLTCTSDQNFKTNIHTLGDNIDFYEQLKTITKQDIKPEDMTTLEKVIAIVPVKYDWKENKDEEYYFNQDINPSNIGFIAQDLELYFPELVAVDVNGNKSVNYANMTPILTEAIRELNLKVNDLSSLDTTSTVSLGSLIKDFLANASNNIGIVFFGEIHTKKLCLDDLCITKDQLQQIIDNNGIDTSDTSSDTDTTSLTCADTETLIDNICVANEPAPLTCEDNQTLVGDVCVDNEPVGKETKTNEVITADTNNDSTPNDSTSGIIDSSTNNLTNKDSI